VRVDNDATIEDPEAFPEPAVYTDTNGLTPSIDDFLVHSDKYIDTRPKVVEVAPPPPK
jgi:hypothetical protein